ncbi:DoxX family protein [Hyphomonas sp.]|uniref:DoxX family protein n=1 Tax=Hyphomonas sp. TaxID=87 RepID=UPI00391A0D4B
MSSAAETRMARALAAIRMGVALLIFIHGAARVAAGGVAPFGAWLETQGFPVGIAWAWGVTGYELVAPALIILRRFVSVLCLGHVGILALGMVMVHLPNGWFVVGLGRNGVEYSVLLILCLAAVAWAEWPGRKKSDAAHGAG